ncbi:MAG: argininosuccinate lyase [Chthoniobacter sp.]|uniref:argininosuccinate lyase n=1 Tax=Chthoniobacter sp. TaxID=2510640 RepID=UPI0032A9BDFE
MWKGRFQQETSALLQQYSESISFDWRLWRHDIAGSIAHSAALQKAGLITAEEREKIVAGLNGIGAEIEAGKFQWKTELEDVHMNIEAELTKRIGDAGAKLHTARSRNDQIALDIRLFLRDACDDLDGLLAEMQRSLVDLGSRFRDVIIPGYTHLQRAQPVYFAHHLLAYVEMFQRDRDRLVDTRKRINVLPLGSGAIAGSTIVLDRELVARELDFPAVTQNSMDAVSDRDFAVELLAALALVAVHLSRISEDVILWASSEFQFIKLSDAFTTGSSLMPQKKNPDVAELTRGKSGRVIGNLVSLLTTLKGLPMTYNRDMQEDKEPVFDSVDTIRTALAVFAAMLREAQANPAACAAAVADPMLLATDLADYLVNHGVPFRKAHEVIGRAVALCGEKHCELTQLTLADYQALSPVFAADVFEMLNVQKSMESRRAIGAPSPQNVAAQLARWQVALADPSQRLA